MKLQLRRIKQVAGLVLDLFNLGSLAILIWGTTHFKPFEARAETSNDRYQSVVQHVFFRGCVSPKMGRPPPTIGALHQITNHASDGNFHIKSWDEWNINSWDTCWMSLDGGCWVSKRFMVKQLNIIMSLRRIWIEFIYSYIYIYIIYIYICMYVWNISDTYIKQNIKHISRIYQTICTYNDNVPISPMISRSRPFSLPGESASAARLCPWSAKALGAMEFWRRELGVKGGISIGIAIKWLFDYIWMVKSQNFETNLDWCVGLHGGLNSKSTDSDSRRRTWSWWRWLQYYYILLCTIAIAISITINYYDNIFMNI